jgi:hypothetical protein
MLFLFYNALLLKALDLLELRLSTLGFADDINLLLQSHAIKRLKDAIKAKSLISRNLG